MFTEVNNLRGLVVNLENFKQEDYVKWDEISQQISCLFLIKNDEQYDQLHVLLPRAQFLVKPFSFFELSKVLSSAIEHMHLQPYEVAYVTTNQDECQNILHLPIGSVLISNEDLRYSNLGHLPDYMLRNVSDVNDILSGKFPGYYGEVMTTQIRKGVFLGNSGYVINFKLSHQEKHFQVISSGRYYGPEHHKHQVHQLSHRILRSKKETSQEVLFQSIFSGILSIVKADGITRVPPRPSDNRDRFSQIVKHLSLAYNMLDLSDVLRCIVDYPTQKALGREARISNVKGKFQATSQVQGKHIVLIDDVFTTGSTAQECATTLLFAGASEVTIVVIGINQLNPAFGIVRNILPCPKDSCNGTMKLKLNKNGGAFFGCSNYWETNCDESLPFLVGWHNKNKLNSIDDTLTISEIDLFEF